MIRFILNNRQVQTDQPAGLALLDFVRYHQHLTGTKIGCREGDCGACTVLVGELEQGELRYRSATCCLMALGNAHGKHIVTIEGLNMETLNPIQQAMSDEGATQCGFCTPGFVVSLAGFCLSKHEPTYTNAIASIDGNICRCTGYKSIEKAAATVAGLLQHRRGGEPVLYATMKNLLPAYFNLIKERLVELSLSLNGELNGHTGHAKGLGGGTDLYVQQHEAMVNGDIRFFSQINELKGIIQVDHTCMVGSAATVTDMLESPIFLNHFPGLHRFIKLVSSTPIRNMATIAGNFVNASPIGDLTVFFLALNARVQLSDGTTSREVALRHFYKGYKQLDKKDDEYVTKILFVLPAENTRFNFEKVCKRTYLDIASVNTAISLRMKGQTIEDASLSAGGVAPIPLYLSKTSAFLQGQVVDEALVNEAVQMALTEISPISDARGTDEYKTLLLGQLIKAHFIKLFPALQVEKILHA